MTDFFAKQFAYIIYFHYLCSDFQNPYNMGKNVSYRARIVDAELELQLESAGIVLIEGAKWCGKTTTAEQHARSVIYMDDPKRIDAYRRAAELEPAQLLEGEKPRLIDEWQKYPQLWDTCRFVVDRSSEDGLFILTGSAKPVDFSKLSHTGTGRVGWIKMRPMSLWESGDSNGTVSLAQLFQSPLTATNANDLRLHDICYLICRGGWPKAIGKSERASLRQAYNYMDSIAKRDIIEVDETNRSEANTRKLLRSYARNQGSQVSYRTIAADMSNNEGHTMSDETVASYIKALQKLFVIEDMEAWNPNLRSKAAIRTASTRYFTDPSMATAALGIGPADLMQDLNTLGLFFETMAVRDLRVYAEANDGQVFHYRDNNNLECDAVIHLRNGHYALVEIKLGGEKLINEGARNLLSLEQKIDTGKMYAPSFKMIVTAVGQYAYRREDGVYIVPISCLKD